MSSWSEFEHDCPEFAARVQTLFQAHRHKTMATLRRDGSPRISGIELSFQDGEAVIGMSSDSLKARDIKRDPRTAIHSGAEDPPEDDPGKWPGDAKLAGHALPIADSDHPENPPTAYRIDISEVSLVKVGAPADHLLVESWHPGRGYESRRR